MLCEAAALLQEAPGTALASKGIWRVRIIEADVQGSSGYYPADTLKRYGPTAFPAGTQIFFDHPSQSEETDRPERSVRDLAGVLLDDAHYEDGPDGKGLFGRIQFFEDMRERVRSMWQHVGLSIRATGLVEETEVRGRRLRVVKSIEGISIDVVTRPGAGGRLIKMTESTSSVSSPQSAQSAVSVATQQDYNELTKMVLEMREAFQNQTVGLTKLTHLLKERDKAAADRLEDIRSMRENFSKVLEADLPNSSKARIIESYQQGQDMDDSIRKEREYLKSVLRERDLKSGAKQDDKGGGLGLSESSLLRSEAPAATDDFAEIESVLSGKLF
jgi:hypothetical protein